MDVVVLRRAFVWFAVIVLVVACWWCLVVTSSVLVVCCDFDSVWVGVVRLCGLLGLWCCYFSVVRFGFSVWFDLWFWFHGL